MCLVAPLSAHTLAKIANGLCDDLLTCSLRAWDFGRGGRPGKPVLLAPAMNTAMWDHPLTRGQLDAVRGFAAAGEADGGGVAIVEPAVKRLACGEVGAGALAELDDIICAVKKHLVQWNLSGCIEASNDVSFPEAPCR